MFDYRTVKTQVMDYIGGYEDDYDVDGIMWDLREAHPALADIDDADDFIWIIEGHEFSEN